MPLNNINELLKILTQIFLIIIILINYDIISKRNKNIRVGIYTYSLKGGGTERMTALFLNYISTQSTFQLFLFSQKYKEKNEYIIPNTIKRIVIIGTGLISTRKLKRQLKKKNVDIFIYQFPDGNEIRMLNNLKNIKIIIYSHFCFLSWLYYYKSLVFKDLYNSFRESKYIISVVPFESDYVFKKWGIKSILMNNLITYEYEQIKPSDLSAKIILMIGRAEDRFKRFELGIESMKYILVEVPDCKMNIISNEDYFLLELIKRLNLEDEVKFIGYTSKPEDNLKNASLHIFPSVSESFGLVLCEVKIFGIPTILTGLDFISLSKGGTIIIYDDKPETIGKEAIKVLTDDIYRKKLGKEARESMKQFKNKLTIKKWIKLIKSIYNEDGYYDILIKKKSIINEIESINLFKNQTRLLKKRESFFKNITVKLLLNYSYLQNIFLNLIYNDLNG